ncbi:MAG: proline--tRNA ligase [Conexivisphaerales archaeon]
MQQGKPKEITVKKSENFDEWYTQVILRSELMDYSPVSGCMVFRPLSYAIWEIIQRATDELFKKEGIQNVYFPLLIPERLLRKEQQHVEGFAPEVAWVTEAGNTKLEERLAIRPTSETIMYESFSKWIRSWRDLPLKFNQWNSVIRWEFKHPTPFLRSREFLWNEGHTVYATKEEAEAERDVILGIYSKITKEYLALPGIIGKKTDKEKFAGAVATYSIEHLLPDGKAIQGPDFHFDGQNFSRAFEIAFLNKEGKREFAWQNTWAITTREIGVMVATHSDDRGLVIPPRVAPIQVVIIPIVDERTKDTVLSAARDIKSRVQKVARVHLDDRDYYTAGWKFNEWEIKGVPLRIEVGPRDIKASQVTFARRDTLERFSVAIDEVEQKVEEALGSIQENLYERAERFLKENIRVASNLSEVREIISKKGGIVQVGWCGRSGCEDRIKEQTGAKITNLPLDAQKFERCIVCNQPSEKTANVAKSY